MNLKEFDPGPLIRAFNGNQPPVVEGRFDVASKLASHASAMGDLAAGADGEFQLTSKGGVFRGLPVSVGNAAESPGNSLSNFSRTVASQRSSRSTPAKRAGLRKYG